MKKYFVRLNNFALALMGCLIKLKVLLSLKLLKSGMHSGREAPRVIVSLTSYGKRVNRCAPFAVFSILCQTVRPEKVILWLDEAHWNDNNLPIRLKRLLPLGLEVRYCKDQRSFTKLVPALMHYPDSVIITVDDDIYYSKYLVEELYAAHLLHKNAIIGRKISIPTFDERGGLNHWDLWRHILCGKSANGDPQRIFPLGFGGVLYPPHSLFADVVKEELFLKLSPFADDIWFFIMAYKKQTPRIQLETRNKTDYNVDVLYQKLHKGNSLWDINVGESRNNSQLNDLLDYYNINL